MTVLPGRYYNFHFTDEETSSKKLSHLTKVSCLEESRVSHILKPIPRDSPHPSRGTWVAKWIYLLSSVLFSGSVVPDSLWHQPSLSITNSQSLLKLISIELVMLSNHLILCHPLLLLPSVFPNIRVFSNESVLCIRWPNYWSSSFSISPSNEYSLRISLRIDWLDLLAAQGILKSLLQHHSSKASALQCRPSLWSNFHIHIGLLEEPWLWLHRPLLAK